MKLRNSEIHNFPETQKIQSWEFGFTFSFWIKSETSPPGLASMARNSMNQNQEIQDLLQLRMRPCSGITSKFPDNLKSVLSDLFQARGSLLSKVFKNQNLILLVSIE